VEDKVIWIKAETPWFHHCLRALLIVGLLLTACQEYELEPPLPPSDMSTTRIVKITPTPGYITRIVTALPSDNDDPGFIVNAGCGPWGGVEVPGSFSWSMDGKYLLTEISRPTSVTSVSSPFVLVSVEQETVISSELVSFQDDKKVTGTALAPDQQSMAYTQIDPSGYQLRVKNLSGEDKLVLTESSGIEFGEPSWTQDGTRIVFLTYQGLAGSLTVLDLDSGESASIIDRVRVLQWMVNGDWATGLRWIANANDSNLIDFPIFFANIITGEWWQIDMGRCVGRPYWSPDGEYVAYGASPDYLVDEAQRPPLADNREIYIMRPDGSDLTNVTRSKGTDDLPAWSPDGKTIAYASYGEVFTDSQDICLVDIREQHPVCITATPGVDEDAPEWSPDGQWIAYLEQDVDGDRYLSIIRPDGSERTRLLAIP
jgi:Tol biopolymer transport system component